MKLYKLSKPGECPARTKGTSFTYLIDDKLFYGQLYNCKFGGCCSENEDEFPDGCPLEDVEE